jgi:hypothetical protein
MARHCEAMSQRSKDRYAPASQPTWNPPTEPHHAAASRQGRSHDDFDTRLSLNRAATERRARSSEHRIQQDALSAAIAGSRSAARLSATRNGWRGANAADAARQSRKASVWFAAEFGKLAEESVCHCRSDAVRYGRRDARTDHPPHHRSPARQLSSCQSPGRQPGRLLLWPPTTAVAPMIAS